MKAEIEKVKELGEEIGYGHLMALASALWRKKIRDNGNSVSGAFIPVIEGFLSSNTTVRKIIENDINVYDKIVSPPFTTSINYFKE